jgi:hypothetical protein
MILILLFLLTAAAQGFAANASGHGGEFSNGKFLPAMGVTTSLRSSGLMGPEAGVGYLSCGREGMCVASGALAGVVGPDEYSTTLGAGLVFFPLTSWFEVSAHWQKQSVTGYHSYLALGSIIMPYVGLIYVNSEKRVRSEYGFTAKWLFKAW